MSTLCCSFSSGYAAGAIHALADMMATFDFAGDVQGAIYSLMLGDYDRAGLYGNNIEGALDTFLVGMSQLSDMPERVGGLLEAGMRGDNQAISDLGQLGFATTSGLLGEMSIARMAARLGNGSVGNGKIPNGGPSSKGLAGRLDDGGASGLSLDDAIGGLRNSSGPSATVYARELAEMSTHHSGNANRVVLGQWIKDGFDYRSEASLNGGTWFETDAKFFSKLSSDLPDDVARSKAWSVNEQFLQIQMEKGVGRIDLYGETIRDVLTNRPTSFTAMEIKYLETNAKRYGYYRDGNSWIKAD